MIPTNDRYPVYSAYYNIFKLMDELYKVDTFKLMFLDYADVGDVLGTSKYAYICTTHNKTPIIAAREAVNKALENNIVYKNVLALCIGGSDTMLSSYQSTTSLLKELTNKSNIISGFICDEHIDDYFVILVCAEHEADCLISYEHKLNQAIYKYLGKKKKKNKKKVKKQAPVKAIKYKPKKHKSML